MTALLILGDRHFNRKIPPVITTKVTITEGMTVRDINKLLLEKGVLDEESIPKELEGYLFPDTYEFYVPQNSKTVIKKIRDNFDKKVLPILGNANMGEIITIASLVEKEAISSTDKKTIVGIINNRLKSGIPLQIDASICYIKEEDNCIPIKSEDLKIKSPYNTYLNKGLPPGPISNPGLESIEAALRPIKSKYLFYITNPKTKGAIFSVTAEEHNRNVEKYLR